MKRTTRLIFAVFCLLALLFSSVSAYALVPFYVGTPAAPSDAFLGSKYYDRLVSVQLTGDMAYDIVNVALSQVGYREGNSFSDLDGENKRGYADYNEYSYWWDGVANRSWCAAFITYCARQAQIPNTVLKGTLAANSAAFDLPMMPKSGTEPRVGDLIFFDWDLDGSSDLVGLVAKAEAEHVLVVHGNYAEYATVTRFSRNQVDVLGYARPAYTSAYWAGSPITLMLSQTCGYIYQDGEYFRRLINTELTGNGA
ncbi:MAG: CHAP domain-containing protein, partial [Clostridia bacterium]|nr:CHAP domain-containing protein [Clostridia bacterium]